MSLDMLFQKNNTASLRKKKHKRKVMGEGDEWRGTVRYMRPLSSTLEWSEDSLDRSIQYNS